MDICFFKEKTKLITKQLKVETALFGYKENDSLFIFGVTGKGEEYLEGLLSYPLDSLEKYTFDSELPLISHDVLQDDKFNSTTPIARLLLPRTFMGYYINKELALFLYNKKSGIKFTSSDEMYIDSIIPNTFNSSHIIAFAKEYKKMHMGKNIISYIEDTDIPVLLIKNIDSIIYANTAALPYIENHAVPIKCKDTIKCKDSEGNSLCSKCPLQDIIIRKKKETINDIFIGIGDKPVSIEIIPSEKNLGDALIIIKPTTTIQADANNDIITNLSHELKTPLSAIMGSVQILKNNIEQNYKNDPIIMKFIDMIEKSSIRLDTVLSAILHFEKSVSTAGLKKEHFLVHSEIKDILKAFLPRITQKHITVKLLKKSKDSVNTTIFSDKYAFRQIFMQIIDNAIKFSPEHSTIQIRYGHNSLRDGKWFYVFNIIDEGPGINEEIRPYIFERFTRTDQEVHTLIGTGMGLAVVKELLNTIGGDISIENLTEGTGTIVSIFIPMQE